MLIFPGLGKRPIAKITAPDLLTVLRKIEVRGTFETAHRAKQRCGQVFRYAIATGRAVHDITADLRGALAPVVTTNHAAVTDPGRVGELLRAIHGYRGNAATRYALKLAALTFVRPGELRHATCTEFDLDHAEWRIPAERMKMREQHVVPLSGQAVELLRELQVLSRRSSFLFPALGNARRPMSENTVNAAVILGKVPASVLALHPISLPRAVNASLQARISGGRMTQSVRQFNLGDTRHSVHYSDTVPGSRAALPSKVAVARHPICRL
jgi:integrase